MEKVQGKRSIIIYSVIDRERLRILPEMEKPNLHVAMNIN